MLHRGRGGADAGRLRVAHPSPLALRESRSEEAVHPTPTGTEPVIIASQTWELSIPGCSSLKEKRSVVRSIKDRLRNRFNVSVSETDHQDLHARAEITVALVTTGRRHADGILDKADTLVEENGRALIVRTRRDFF